jgi:hypothetical protein
MVRHAGASRRSTAFLYSLFSDLSAGDIARLYSFEAVAKSCTVFGLPSCSIVPFNIAKAPWPLAWAAVARNRKHIQRPPRAPNICDVSEAIQRFLNKLSWSIELKNVPAVPVIAKYRGASVPPCRLQDDLPLECWKSTLYSLAMKAAYAARRSALNHGDWYSNVGTLDRLSSSLLRAGLWTLVPRDKGSGYVLHLTTDLAAIHRSILFSNDYTQVPPPQWHSIISAYVSHVNAVCINFFPEDIRSSVRSQLLRSLHRLRSSPSAVLKIIRTTSIPPNIVTCIQPLILSFRV